MKEQKNLRPTRQSPYMAFASRCYLACLVIQILGCARAADPFADDVRKTEPLTPEEELKTFHVPPGFEVQLVASEPDIGKPMNMAFDARGRLWLTQSREYPYAAPLDKPGRDKIRILESFNAQGRAAKFTTFAEGLNIPIGLYPFKDGVIAFSIPNIYFFEDTNRDGVSDRKELVLGRFGFEKDVHGLTSSFRRGYDGLLYADHGYNNDTVLTARDGSTIKMNSGNTYRFQLDGSHVEQFTWGQVNPFGLMFDPLGDLWSADCHSSPVYQLLRGSYYPSFGKPNDGLGFGPNICDHLHGSTAIAGMVYYSAAEFPASFHGNTFVGNVVTCRINRDSFVEHGSTRIAKEEPDFLSSDDPWFRPVDLQLGPDGAMYVADFYNRIIGHYEVPLTHPGRDRERGRIWRIVYRGTPEAKSAATEPFDLSKKSAPEIVDVLRDPNITRRMLAMNELVDRFGAECVPAVKTMMADSNAAPSQKVHGLWVLHRLNSLEKRTLMQATADSDISVRVHAMRVLEDMPNWTGDYQTVALKGLGDENAYVRRAAAEAFGYHASPEGLQGLLTLLPQIPAEDEQLIHVSRMALRNQLASPVNASKLQSPTENEAESRTIADVAMGIQSSNAGRFLLNYVLRFTETKDKLRSYLRHVARFAPEEDMAKLASFVQKTFSDDKDFQLALFAAVEEGRKQRGGTMDQSMREWGTTLAQTLLDSVDSASLGWHNIPISGAETLNPWFLQERASADGNKDAVFLCSLPPGGERLMGSLRSPPFDVPAKLSFYAAGHDGIPASPPEKKNFIRLRDAASNGLLAESSPPRNDLAQPFSWELTAHAGKKAYLEILDGNSGGAYAWLAVGRFEPSVVPWPKLSPNEVDKRQAAAAELAGSLHIDSLAPKLTNLLQDSEAAPDARAAAAKALALIQPDQVAVNFSNVLSQASEPLKLRAKLAEILGGLNLAPARELLSESFRTAPHNLQKELALALAGNREGAQVLLQDVADGKASARLLQERNIKERLVAANPPDVAERISQLTKNLPPAADARQKVIDARRAAFEPTVASSAQGAQTFKTYCAVCHSIEGVGANIAPQLDGAGSRGADRLMEDILDPNRNVDRAFRNTILVRNDGDVESGLFRREEGEMLVLAQATGKEISIPKKDVRERRESETSLMPDNFSDVIPLKEFNDLIAFLLSKNPKR